MRILLDTNIVIHRETPHVVNKDIGVLFRWLDKLHYAKYLHPVTITEVNKHKEKSTRETFNIKMDSYNILKAPSPLHPVVQTTTAPVDINENDRNDTLLLNELYNDRVDFLITEDKKIRRKAVLLEISDRVFTIETFLEKVAAENPVLTDYKVLSVKKELFGNINLQDEFFDSFREDYPDFDRWFNRKSEEEAYICTSESGITAFLYLKLEDERELYSNFLPPFAQKKRLKIGTFKVTLNGYRLGERFLKIIFDNALQLRVEEIYVTIFDKNLEQRRLMELLEDFGFIKYGIKKNVQGDELVYARSMERNFNAENPKITYPFFSRSSRIFLVPIYPKYHTDLFPDSILRTESPKDFVEHEPFRNAISKVYISRSIFRDLRPGDVLIFYRTGGLYKGVISTIGKVENTVLNIPTVDQFIRECRKRSVFTDEELLLQWNYNRNYRPFVVNFLYSYSFPTPLLNLAKLIEMGVIQDVNSVPRGFEPISSHKFEDIIKEARTNDRIIVD